MAQDRESRILRETLAEKERELLVNEQELQGELDREKIVNENTEDLTRRIEEMNVKS